MTCHAHVGLAPDAEPVLYKLNKNCLVSTYRPPPISTHFFVSVALGIDQSKSVETEGAVPPDGITVKGNKPNVLFTVDLNAEIFVGDVKGAIHGYLPIPVVL